MHDPAELVELANENFVASYAKLADHCEGGELRRFGGVVAYVTGLPISLFNGCVVVESATGEDLDEALAWVSGHEVPKLVFVAEEHDSDVSPAAVKHGLEREVVRSPGMVLEPIPEAPAPATGVAVSEAGLDEFRAVFTAFGRDPELAAKLFPASLLDDADVQPFVGRLEGRLVGYSLAITSRETSGVYNVGTVPEARRRGVGTALTWAAVDAGRRAGYDCAVLQSSEMAIPMYEAMGFRTVVRYAVYSEPARGIGQETPSPRRSPSREG